MHYSFWGESPVIIYDSGPQWLIMIVYMCDGLTWLLRTLLVLTCTDPWQVSKPKCNTAVYISTYFGNKFYLLADVISRYFLVLFSCSASLGSPDVLTSCPAHGVVNEQTIGGRECYLVSRNLSNTNLCCMTTTKFL